MLDKIFIVMMRRERRREGKKTVNILIMTLKWRRMKMIQRNQKRIMSLKGFDG